MNNPAPNRTLVLWSLVIMIALSASTLLLGKTDLSKAIKIDSEGQPTIGYPKALVHVVMFEEPKCPECKRYNNSIYPILKKDFIDTSKVKYTVFTVSFIPNSMPAAVALLCAYNKERNYPNSQLFFAFLDYMYAHQPKESEDWATLKNLEEMAKNASPAINLDKLKDCVEHEGYRVQIVKNTEYGADLMDGRLSTPTMYVDGIRVEEMSLETISKLIQQIYEKKGGA